MTYTYTIFDADPSASSGTAWPTHQDIEIEAASDEDALEAVRDVMSIESAGLSAADGYVMVAEDVTVVEPGDRLAARWL